MDLNYDQIFLELRAELRGLAILKGVYEDSGKIEELANRFAGLEKIIVIGTGGATLGSKALLKFHCLSANCEERVRFLENADPKAFLNCISTLDRLSTGILVISKSGRTTETLMLMLNLMQAWPDFDFENRALVITEASQANDLWKIASHKKIKIVGHDKDISGRFSVFSVVGMLPSRLGGVCIESFRRGARSTLEGFLQSESAPASEIFQDCVQQHNLYRQGIFEHVLFLYSDFLADFGKWFVQLVSESLGKSRDYGVTPLVATGTIDQHSLLQLCLAGPRNKFYTVVAARKLGETEAVHAPVQGEILDRLAGHTLAELMWAHQGATLEGLRGGAAARSIELEEFSAESLGALMMRFVLETLGLAKLADLNPFDQPDVDHSKKLVLQSLPRGGGS
jgi:glucose-6-phosphate isomerase